MRRTRRTSPGGETSVVSRLGWQGLSAASGWHSHTVPASAPDASASSAARSAIGGEKDDRWISATARGVTTGRDATCCIVGFACLMLGVAESAAARPSSLFGSDRGGHYWFGYCENQPDDTPL